MPVMSAIEQMFCRSTPWRAFARRTILPWATSGTPLAGDVLELGAGSGAMAEGVARTHPQVRLTVTDLDPAMVRAASHRLSGLPGVAVKQADVTALPFDDGSFDAVTSYLMLHHVIDWPTALVEAARVLRHDGILLGYDLTNTAFAADPSSRQIAPPDAGGRRTATRAGSGRVRGRDGAPVVPEPRDALPCSPASSSDLLTPPIPNGIGTRVRPRWSTLTVVRSRSCRLTGSGTPGRAGRCPARPLRRCRGARRWCDGVRPTQRSGHRGRRGARRAGC